MLRHWCGTHILGNKNTSACLDCLHKNGQKAETEGSLELLLSKKINGYEMEKKAFAFLCFFYLTRVELGEKQATF